MNMQVLDKQALDMMVFTNLNKVPFGVNIKQYFLEEFENSPAGWDEFFGQVNWQSLSEEDKDERHSLLDQALDKFDLKRAVFDK